LELPANGLGGSEPLTWWGVGTYRGPLRLLLLDLRRHPHRATIAGLVQGLSPTLLQCRPRPLLVPIPSWKRKANPLPGLFCAELEQQLGLRRVDLLERSRPVLGQHHLNRPMRFANQAGSFR
jgi:hypothetical protein